MPLSYKGSIHYEGKVDDTILLHRYTRQAQWHELKKNIYLTERRLEEYNLNFMGKSTFQCWVREGNEGIDCNINFRPLLRLGDAPKSLWGGVTLLLLGEEDLMPVLGEQLPRSISGISSSGTVWKFFSNLGTDRRILGFPSFWLVYNPEEDPTVRKEVRGSLPFEEKGSGTNGLAHKFIVFSYNKLNVNFINQQKV